jgi:DNA-binding transcriptional ArsR family regulator
MTVNDGAGRPEGEATQTKRAFRLREALLRAMPYSCTLEDLAAQVGVSIRTVRRDLAVLAELGEAEAVRLEGNPAREWRWARTEKLRGAFDVLLDKPLPPEERAALSIVLDVFSTRKWGAQALKRLQSDRVHKAG